MIGFYNYSVILTYIGLASSVFGITQVFEGHESIAFLCLLLSGICDLFDGKIARSMKNRTDHEKVFGIQIDSLCDLVCFGVFPAVIGYHYGFNNGLGLLSAVMIVLGAVIRLGYFNVILNINVKKLSLKGILILFTMGAIILIGYLKFNHII